MLLRWLLAPALVSAAACGGEAPVPVEGSTPPASASVAAPPAPAFRWVELDQAAADLDAKVAEHGRTARALGLLPIVHIRSTWNTGGTLRRHKDAELVQRALEGVYLIEIDFPEADCPGRCENAWSSPQRLCSTWAQALHLLDDRGGPGTLSASPGKNGPANAEDNAIMIREFRRMVGDGTRADYVPIRRPG